MAQHYGRAVSVFTDSTKLVADTQQTRLPTARCDFKMGDGLFQLELPARLRGAERLDFFRQLDYIISCGVATDSDRSTLRVRGAPSRAAVHRLRPSAAFSTLVYLPWRQIALRLQHHR